MDATQESPVVMATMPKYPAVMAAKPEPCHFMAVQVSPRDFLKRDYNTQTPVDNSVWFYRDIATLLTIDLRFADRNFANVTTPAGS